ncbi:MAG: leucine-rich repeat protein [Oscillospiraceae bacterium]|nr:leucine-rich repeat protein [Oscillospiraceae bacterium]
MKHRNPIIWLSAAILGISAAAFCSAVPAHAAQYNGGLENGLEYTYDTVTHEAVITGYTGSSRTVVIPAVVPEGMTVTAIGENAFCPSIYPHSYPADITAVTIPNTVRTVGKGAFQSTPLQTIELPASVQTVGEFAFDACPDLRTVKINGNVTVERCAFRCCPSLQTVEIKGTSAIGENAFNTCDSLWKIELKGVSEIGENAFQSCAALYSARIHPDSTAAKPAFNYCSSLTRLNGTYAFSYGTDIDGNQYPKLDFDAGVRSVIRNIFSKCDHVGFVDKFCKALCKHIVKTETGYDPDGPANQPTDWMNEALKARQLHDWLIRHVQYEDELNGETLLDRDNQLYSSVFLSYELNTRAYGVGESVCAGYAKAYKMLLAAAGMEAYVVQANRIDGELGHAWNLVRIGDRYYECDPTWDDTRAYWGQYGTSYDHFLKSDAEMAALHHHDYYAPFIKNCANEHELLEINYQTGVTGLSQCTQSYADANRDGILDYDFDLNGRTGSAPTADYWNDLLARQQLCGQQPWNFGYNTDINGKLPEVLYRLHQLQHGFFA